MEVTYQVGRYLDSVLFWNPKASSRGFLCTHPYLVSERLHSTELTQARYFSDRKQRERNNAIRSQSIGYLSSVKNRLPHTRRYERREEIHPFAQYLHTTVRLSRYIHLEIDRQRPLTHSPKRSHYQLKDAYSRHELLFSLWWLKKPLQHHQSIVSNKTPRK